MELNLDCFRDYPLLHTKRLLLRRFAETDAPALFQLRSQPRVNTFIHRPPMSSGLEAEKVIQDVNLAWEQRLSLSFACCLRESGEFIGSCGFRTIDQANRRAEIGGELHPLFWGQGLPLEAVRAVLQLGFEQINLHSIEARIMPANRGARWILEKLGFVQEGYYRDYIYLGESFGALAVCTKLNPHHSTFVSSP